MYNHYIPQSDGSYRRSAPPDQRRPAPPPKPQPEPPKPEPPKPEPPRPCPPPQPVGVLDFLKSLLPRQLDAADLMIVFLLLLMNRDDETGLSPMLTLALYFLL